MLAVFETGVRYHIYHAVALLLTAAIMGRIEGRFVVAAGWFFTAGIVLFSGSLYLPPATRLTLLRAVKPLRGGAFLLGWACLAVAPPSEPRVGTPFSLDGWWVGGPLLVG